MARFRRKTCVTLLLFVVFLLGVMVGLKTLRPEGAGFGSPFALGLLAEQHHHHQQQQPPQKREQGPSPEAQPERPGGDLLPLMEIENLPEPNYGFHVFYYSWYGSPQLDGKYIHWNHPLLAHWDPKLVNSYPRGRHSPPEDIAASFYPELGPYSSRDPKVIDAHMAQIRSACIGVVAISWYPPGMADENGEPTDDIVPLVLDAAHKYHLKVAFHIEPYKDRDDRSMYSNVKYIVDKYGGHPAFYRYKTSTGRTLPMFYIYDSYITSPESWGSLLTVSGFHSVRNTPYDGLFIALLVEEKHMNDILKAGFDGMYTYFATNGFSFGSSHHKWPALKAFCDSNNLMFIPSVGPGYLDTSVRPWNSHNTRNRVSGKYYETALSTALLVRPDVISVTSFNEWHEGTQIESAVPKQSGQIVYQDYRPYKPNLYLELTRKWAEKYSKEKEQWLM
ncbi:glycoprotein endo-alpha-1,2-mannosidase [Latimeria chalumnae]|uniref:Glycoprotein endo-alpha-1,2-mannosidase n=1 Tax=Latimeria chalumnae TaxID=7897 RepID=H3AVC1_LATCH|nr:PREDICTED: glycoprotein endo-alpha-1,2-mannosidase isoform X2 [Latimeria chalumnae]|eukprot:XP_006004938.1 PREDICTED: glycoprotein endo-alpha-1,2-mannosidase isoform X2 [Latimeria chalumnae]